MAALTEVVRAGKARYIGFSEWTAEQIQAVARPEPRHGYEKFVSSQPQYSMLWREPEREVIPLCAANGISQIVWSPLAQGALTGNTGPAQPPPEGSRAASERMGRMMGDWLDGRRARARAAARPDRRAARASRWRSSRSPGCCASRTSPRRSSARRGPSRCTTTPRRPGSSSTRRRSRRSTRS